MKAIVLAGGKGTRLAPYTHILPKPLMPIGDMPILEVLLKQMKTAGITEVTLTVGHLSELLKSYFNSGERWGLQIDYSYEDKPLGTAGPIALIDGLNDTFLVTNGDILTTLNFQDLIRFHHSRGAMATIASHKRVVKIDLGVIERGNQCGGKMDSEAFRNCAFHEHCNFWMHGCQVIGYNEKPSYDYVVSMGAYVFDSQVVGYIPRNEYLDFPDLVLKLIAAGERVVSYPYEGYWKDLGRPDDYEEANRDFEELRGQFLIEE